MMDSSMDQPPADILVGPRRSMVWPLVVLALIAFVAGGVATGWAARRWERVAALVLPKAPVPPVQVVRVPVPTPVPGAAASAQGARLEQQVSAIDQKLEAVEARAVEANRGADRAEELLITFAARRAIERGVDLGYLEGMLREHFGTIEPQATAAVISGARRPVTLAGLRLGLASAEGALVRAETQDSGWTAFRRELSNLIVLRRSGTDSTAPLDRFDRATKALEAGEVDRALIEVSRMPGRAGAAQWIADARRYVATRNALDRLETAALMSVTPRASATPAASLP